MRNLLFHIACLLVICGPGIAQTGHGVNGQKDTSFTTRSAFEAAVKKHHGIRIAEELRCDSIKEERNIVYCVRSGRKLLLDAFYPAQAGQKRAAVMMIHGGGWRSGDRSQHHPLVRRLAAMGYVCFTPEYRLSPEALYPAAVHDLKAALRWIRSQAEQFNIDTAKIAVAGFSAGGQLATLLGTTQHSTGFEGDECKTAGTTSVNAVINIDGILAFIHPESGEGDDTRKLSAATQWFGYTRSEKVLPWIEASPLTHAGPHTAPVLFINSSVARMHAGREDFIHELKRHRIYSEVHSFPDAPHTFVLFEPWFSPVVKHIDIFLKKVFSVHE